LNRDRVYLEHILECIRRIDEDVAAGREAFLASHTIQDAVLRNLQILSESAQRVSQKAKDMRREIPWRDIANFRNRVVHDYFHIDLDIVWGIIHHDLPQLKQAVQSLAANKPS